MYHRPAGSAISIRIFEPMIARYSWQHLPHLFLATRAPQACCSDCSINCGTGTSRSMLLSTAITPKWTRNWRRRFPASRCGLAIRSILPAGWPPILNRLFGPLLPRSLQRPFRELAECDLVCLVGGTTFEDSMLFKVPWNAMAAWPAMLTRRNYIMLSQTLGPFERRLN